MKESKLKKVKVSAPGKLMLFGEHAVVYGYPCIATAVDQRIYVELAKLRESLMIVNSESEELDNYAKDLTELGKGEVPKGARFVEMAVKNYISKYPIKGGVELNITADFSSQFGFGSSSAVTVAVVYGLARLSGKKLSNKEFFDICFKTVLDIQGKGSGYDIATAIWGKTVYFVGGGKKIRYVPVSKLPMEICYTGRKADTVTLIDKVGKLKNSQKELVNDIFVSIGKLVDKACQALIKNDWTRLAELMQINEGYLEALGVGTKQISNLISVSYENKALAAKISGAGGGDCIIILNTGKKLPKEVYLKQKGVIIDVKTNAEGVRIES